MRGRQRTYGHMHILKPFGVAALAEGKLTEVGLTSSSGRSASSPYHGGTEEKAEVVPASGVVHLVDGDLVAEKRNDERKRQDEPVPQPKPKAGYGTVRARGILVNVRSGGTASREA